MYVTSKCTEPVRSLFCTNSVTSCKLCANSRAKMGGVKKKEWVIDIVASAGHYKEKTRGQDNEGQNGLVVLEETGPTHRHMHRDRQ